MVKWENDDKNDLLRCIVEHMNPGAIPWDKIAAAMGSKFSPQACRGQYNIIKKGFKTPEPTESGPSTISSSTTIKTSAKGKKPAAANNPTSAAKGRKRKAVEASLDVNTGPAEKVSKVKMGGDTGAKGAAEDSNTEQVQHDQGGQDGVHQGAYPEHHGFIYDNSNKAPYKSPYADDA